MAFEAVSGSFRADFLTETALVKVQNDIAKALDQKHVVVLVMLDLSSAFDVIDHGITLTRLQHSFGVTAEALDWMRSYIRPHNFVQRTSMQRRATRIRVGTETVLHMH